MEVMANPNNSYQTLIEKLDSFIRKYYTNQIIRGAIFSAVYVLAFFLAINLMEYYLYLPSLLRKLLFFGFLLSSGAFLSAYLFMPLLHYYRLGKIISYEQAANIIGIHFTEVKDKLLNILQLKQAADNSESALLLAAIDQKSVTLKPVNFSLAIDLRKNRKYLRYLIPPLVLFIVIMIAAPNVIKEGTERLYHSDTFYAREAPFQFIILNKELKALQFGNFDLEVKTEGDALPAEVYLETAGHTVKLKKKDKNRFAYEFDNLQTTASFRFSANGFLSKEYTLEVTPKPVVASFEVRCEYPPYTGKKNETVKNIGDLMVPTGTRLTWHFNTQNVASIAFVLGDSTYAIPQNGNNEFVFSKRVFQSSPYTIKVSNHELKNADSVSYSLSVIPDLYPEITVTEKRDSAVQKYFYYIGNVSDDYGLRRLTFNYQITRDGTDSTSPLKSVEVPIHPGLQSPFTYYWSLTDFAIKPGDRMSYYFEVWDNDGINGSKSTRSNLMNFDMPSLSELNKEITKDNKAMKDELKQTMKDAQSMKNDLQKMKDNLMDKNNLSWEDKKNLQDNIEKQKALQDQIKEMKEKLAQNFEKQDEFKDVPESIKEKQKNLQDLMDKVLDEDMKKLMDKLEKMLDELQKKDALDKMTDMQMSNENLSKELDRMLELFKKLEFDQKLQETAQKLDELAKQQEDLSKKQAENQDGKTAKNDKELQQEQQKIQQGLKDAKQDLKDLKKLNEETQSNQDFSDIEKNLETADKQMSDAQQNQQQQQNSKASQNQQSAANNMKDASQKLNDMKMQMEQAENAEDMQAIRQLLKNIIQLSFDQEKLMDETKNTNINNPKYVKLMSQQQRIRESSKMVEDSLYALAKRQDQIKSFITKEMVQVNKHLTHAINNMEDRDVSQALSDQQFVMTGFNNLALMLSEALQQMQMQMSQSQQQKQGMKMCQKCNKPGNGLPNLSQMQKQLNDKISQAAEMLKRQGQNGQQANQEGMSKQFAEMAQMQEQIRRELERINQQNDNAKNPSGNLGEAIQQMKETEKNLVNKQITAEMLKRQQQIMSRMLDAENAERQRDQQPERESKTGKDEKREMPPSLEEYLKAKQNETDLYQTVPPALRPYYKNLAEKYFRTITIQP